MDSLSTALIRGAFEYQGQKCSAASRLYVPDSLWPNLRKRLCEDLEDVQIGGVENFENFMNALISKESFAKVKAYIQQAKNDKQTSIVFGGNCDDKEGYFIEPTVIEVHDPKHVLLREEIFGPLLSVYVYPEREYEKVLTLVDSTSPYGLTGAIFAQDPTAITKAEEELRYAAGNFYINDKPTGAVVGQQPFGGGRASGTNDKAGASLNLLRWTSPRTIKETFVPPQDFSYPFMK